VATVRVRRCPPARVRAARRPPRACRPGSLPRRRTDRRARRSTRPVARCRDAGARLRGGNAPAWWTWTAWSLRLVPAGRLGQCWGPARSLNSPVGPSPGQRRQATSPYPGRSRIVAGQGSFPLLPGPGESDKWSAVVLVEEGLLGLVASGPRRSSCVGAWTDRRSRPLATCCIVRSRTTSKLASLRST